MNIIYMYAVYVYEKWMQRVWYRAWILKLLIHMVSYRHWLETKWSNVFQTKKVCGFRHSRAFSAYLWKKTIFWSIAIESESKSLSHDQLFATLWSSPGQNTEVGSLSLLQGIFPTQGSNPGLPHCRRILYQQSHKGSPRRLVWVAYPFSSRSSIDWVLNFDLPSYRPYIDTEVLTTFICKIDTAISKGHALGRSQLIQGKCMPRFFWF